MSKNKKLNDFEDAIRQCVQCGACQAHCPAYRLSRREGDVARGKIALASSLLDGSIALENRLVENMGMCLLCGSCVNKCPNQVATPQIVAAIRREITEDQGLSPIGRSVSAVTKSRGLLQAASKGGALLAPLLLKRVPKSSGLRLRLPLPQMDKRTLPKIPFRNLFDRVPEFLEGDGEKPTVGFFAGCAISYIYPDIGVSMVEILRRLGYSVHIPRSQKCCGIPALSAGAGKAVESLAADNIKAFGKYEEAAVITACASCYSGIGEYYATMEHRENSLSDLVVDFSTFLAREGIVERLGAMEPWRERTSVTYHDPCHLKNHGITSEPRALLEALPNVDFVEMDGASLCCGLGGTFSVYHYDASRAIGAQKMPGLQESGARKIATACPGCIIQLQDSINHAGLEVEAVHILTLLQEALAQEKS